MKRLFTLPMAVTALLLICAGFTYGQGGGKKGMKGGDTAFVAKNIKDNMQEINLSKLALEKSASQEIKDIAQQMVDDHSQMLADLRAYKQGGPATGGAEGGISRPGDTATASNELDITGNKSSQMQGDTAGMQSNMDMHDDMSSNADHKKDKMGKHDKDHGLKDLSGSQFDNKWVSNMLMMHQAKLKELNAAATSVSDPQLKTIINSAIPKVQMHVDKLTSAKKGLASKS